MNTPLVNVLMPIYNAKDYLNEAIDSLIAQTYYNWELIAIDDASTDNSVEILLSHEDSRIHLVKKINNTGSYDALNQGLKKASGKYIAILDADDVCHPERFQKQVDFLEANPHIGLCGSWIKAFGLGKERIWRYPTESEEIRCGLLFQNCFAHSSIMMRNSILQQHKLIYKTIRMAQDYDLWVRMSELTQTANLKMPLVFYRLYDNSKSARKLQEQQMEVDKIIDYQLQKLKIEFTYEDLLFHSYFTYRKNQMPPLSFSLLRKTFIWCYKLLKANYSTKLYRQGVFILTLHKIYFENMIKILLRKKIDSVLFSVTNFKKQYNQ